MITTPWKTYKEGKRTYRIQARYGLHKIGTQEPYFSVTGSIDRAIPGGRWYEESGGQLHKEIAKHFPQLRPLLKWHLVSIEKGPMHYLANADFWWKEYQSLQGKPGERIALENFKDTIIFGGVAGDRLPPEDATPAEIRGWLTHRLPVLMRNFHRALDENGILPMLPSKGRTSEHVRRDPSSRLQVDDVVQFRFEPGTGGVIQRFESRAGEPRALALVATTKGPRLIPTDALRKIHPNHEARVRSATKRWMQAN